LLFLTTIMDEEIQDVASTPEAASTEVVDSSTTVTEPSGESQGSVTATDVAQQGTQATEADPLEGVPSAEELQRLIEQKVPHSEALARLRPAYEGLKTKLAEYEPLESWKPLVEQIGDPELAKSSYSLITSIHTPSEESPSGFTSRPFIEQIDQESPGTANQIFVDLCSYVYTDENGQRTTPVREMYKAHGLDPDRIDDYRNIDQLRASGVVTQEDLTAIPEKYHGAFRALSTPQREDIMAQRQTDVNGKVTYPAATLDYLQDKTEALEARQWREQDTQAKAAQKQQEEAAFEQHVTQAVETDVLAKVKSWNDSIHQNLSSQWKPSSDAAQNDLEYAKVLSTLATLQFPAYRFVAENALKSVGVSLDGFDDLVNQWQASRSAYVVFNEKKDVWQAKREEAKATQAEQRILIKLNDYALKLAQVSGNRLQSQSEQTTSQLAAASSRFVPSGNGATQQGFQNPYEQNPHSVGSPEYYAFNRKVDREYSLTNASVFQ
jgi:hypothetical protein